MFARAFKDQEEIGWFLSHGQDYGVYLELANDRKSEAIRPIIIELLPKFLREINKLY